MSRNRLSDLQTPSSAYNNQAPQQDGYGNYDLERNDFIAGEQYELQDRSPGQIGLNEYLNEVYPLIGSD